MTGTHNPATNERIYIEQDKLHALFNAGRALGRITDVSLAIYAYGVDEHLALEWVTRLVNGDVSQKEARRRLKDAWLAHALPVQPGVPRWETRRWDEFAQGETYCEQG